MKIEELNIINGENSHQKADFEPSENSIDCEFSSNLSFSELMSITKGLNLISEFYDVKAACAVKPAGICGVALGQTISDAVTKVIDTNPIDFIDSVVVISDELDSESAKFFKENNIVAAPNFTKNALEVLEMHSVKYVKINTPLKDYKKYLQEDIKVTPFGNLVQSPNCSELNKDSFKVETKTKPTVEQIEDAVFAWKVAKHINSQAIVIAKDLKTNAIAHGVNSAAVEFALDYSCDMSKEASMASDMPIRVHDVNTAAQGRISLIIVPSADKDVIKTAEKYNISLITTGITNILN